MGDTQECTECGETVTFKATTADWGGRRLRFWSHCACIRERTDRNEHRSKEAIVRMRGSRADLSERVGALDSFPEYRQRTLDTFVPGRLETVGTVHPYSAVLGWWSRIRTQEAAPRGEPGALMLVGETGRGKTHLAAALGNLASADGRRVMFLNELTYLQQAWGLPLDQLHALVYAATMKAWLLIVDDIGKREVGNAAGSIQNAYYALLAPRLETGRFTICTSEFPLSELLTRNTLNASLHGRLYQSCGGQEVVCVGANARLDGAR